MSTSESILIGSHPHLGIYRCYRYPGESERDWEDRADCMRQSFLAKLAPVSERLIRQDSATIPAPRG